MIRNISRLLSFCRRIVTKIFGKKSRAILTCLKMTLNLMSWNLLTSCHARIPLHNSKQNKKKRKKKEIWSTEQLWVSFGIEGIFQHVGLKLEDEITVEFRFTYAPPNSRQWIWSNLSNFLTCEQKKEGKIIWWICYKIENKLNDTLH